MTTTTDLVERLFSMFLEPPDELATHTQITTAINNSSSTSVDIDLNQLSPDEQLMFAPGVEAEIDYERFRITDYANGTVTFEREWRGTTKAAHNIGAIIRLPVSWSRADALDTIYDALEFLYPPLVIEKQRNIPIGRTLFEAPSDQTVATLAYRWWDGTRWHDGDAEILHGHPDFTRGIAIQVGLDAMGLGTRAHLVYGEAPKRPTAPTAVLEIPVRHEIIVIVHAASQMVAGKDLDLVTQEYITETLASQGFPVRSASQITSSLIAYRDFLVRLENERLLSKYGSGLRQLDTVYLG